MTSETLTARAIAKHAISKLEAEQALDGVLRGTSKLTVRPGSLVRLRRPFLTSSGPGVDLNFTKTLWENVAYETPDVACYFYNNATVTKELFSVRCENGIVDSETMYNCPDVSSDRGGAAEVELRQSEPANSSYSEAKIVDGWSVLVANRWASNYRHWHSECVPSILLMKDILGPREATWIVPECSEFHYFTLQALGIPRAQIFELKDYDVLCRNLVVPNSLFERTWVSNSASSYLKAYKSLIQGKTKISLSDHSKQKHFNQQGIVNDIPRRRIYVTRRDSPVRPLLNERYVENIMEDFGFEIVNNSILTPSEQAVVFSEAEIIVGAHGAGLTNCVFASEGAIVVELRPSDVHGRSPFWDRSDWSLCNALGLQYGSICFLNDPQREDWQIDLEHLRSTFTTLGW